MKHFLVILVLTILVWLGISMSEEQQYPVHVRIEMTGYDTIRYALLQADTSLEVTATLSGFDALRLGLRSEPTVQCPVANDTALTDRHYSIPVSSLNHALRNAIPGATRVAADRDSLHLILSPRSHRSYRPRIDHVHFSFAEQYGLYGEPVMTPDSIPLYGPEEALSRIDALQAQPAEICNIKNSDHFSLTINPVWEQYPDIHPSATAVDLYLPVEAYVEQEFKVPIQVIGADTNASLKLYPDQATVRVWMAQRDIQNAPELTVAVNYNDILPNAGRLKPTLLSFPDYVRPRAVQPDIVQCVVIK